MTLEAILSSIDSEISRLQHVRSMLAETHAPVPEKRKVGRPKKVIAAAPIKKKRVMSAEGKARIAAAQKKRWAARKKTS